MQGGLQLEQLRLPTLCLSSALNCSWLLLLLFTAPLVYCHVVNFKIYITLWHLSFKCQAFTSLAHTRQMQSVTSDKSNNRYVCTYIRVVLKKSEISISLIFTLAVGTFLDEYKLFRVSSRSAVVKVCCKVSSKVHIAL